MSAILAGQIYDAGECVDLTPVTTDIMAEIGQEIVDTAGAVLGGAGGDASAHPGHRGRCVSLEGSDHQSLPSVGGIPTT